MVVIFLLVLLISVVGLMTYVMRKSFKELTSTTNNSMKVMCINTLGFEYSLISGRCYYVIDIKDNEDGSKSYKVIDEFYDEIWVNEKRFVKVDD